MEEDNLEIPNPFETFRYTNSITDYINNMLDNTIPIPSLSLRYINISVENYDFIRNLINETLEKIKDKPANIAITKEDLTTLLTQILDKLENY